MSKENQKKEEDKIILSTELKKGEKYDMVFIIGKDIKDYEEIIKDEEFIKNNCKNLKYCIIGDGKRNLKPAEVEDMLNNKTDESTIFYIDGHGYSKKINSKSISFSEKPNRYDRVSDSKYSTHYISIFEGDENDNVKSTKDSLKIIKKIHDKNTKSKDDKDKPMILNLWSCHGGAADVPENISAILHSGKKYSTSLGLSFMIQRSLLLLQSKLKKDNINLKKETLNALNYMVSFLFANTSYFVDNSTELLEKDKFKFSAAKTKEDVKNPEKFLNKKFNAFLTYLKDELKYDLTEFNKIIPKHNDLFKEGKILDWIINVFPEFFKTDYLKNYKGINKENESAKQQILSRYSELDFINTIFKFQSKNAIKKMENYVGSDEKEDEFNANIQLDNGFSTIHATLPLYEGHFLSVNLKALKLLLKQENIDINMKDNKGQTPLIAAIRNYDLRTIDFGKDTVPYKMILEHSNIDVNIQDNEGKTALFYCIDRNLEAVFNSVLNHKNKEDKQDIDVNLSDNKGNTALTYCLIKKDRFTEKFFKQLINHPNIDINKSNKLGENVLYYAVKNKNRLAIKELLNHKNKQGEKDINIDKMSSKKRYELLIMALEQRAESSSKDLDYIIELILNHENQLNSYDKNNNQQNEAWQIALSHVWTPLKYK